MLWLLTLLRVVNVFFLFLLFYCCCSVLFCFTKLLGYKNVVHPQKIHFIISWCLLCKCLAPNGILTDIIRDQLHTSKMVPAYRISIKKRVSFEGCGFLDFWLWLMSKVKVKMFKYSFKYVSSNNLHVYYLIFCNRQYILNRNSYNFKWSINKTLMSWYTLFHHRYL